MEMPSDQRCSKLDNEFGGVSNDTIQIKINPIVIVVRSFIDNVLLVVRRLTESTRPEPIIVCLYLL